MPYGRDLRGEGLKKDLSGLFKVYAENAEKNALSSPQANKSFNNMVAEKAPKSRHYSGSENLCFKLGAAVSLKNIGQNYLSEVYERAGIPQTVRKETRTQLVKSGKQKKMQDFFNSIQSETT